MRMYWKLLIICFLVALTGVIIGSPVRCGTFESDAGEYEKGTFVFLENDFYRLEFDPSRGGRCRNFILKEEDTNFNGDSRHSGFFLDHWGKYQWPSGLFEKPYQYEFIDDSKGSKSIRLWRIDDGKGSQGGFSGTYDDPLLRGLKVQKTITLYADKQYIDVEQAVINSTGQPRGVSVYLQHVFAPGEEKQVFDCYSIPATSGISTFNLNRPQGKRELWAYEPVAGWLGCSHEQTGRGLVFLLDYNYLEKMYSSGASAEWWYENVMIPPGREWTTHYKIIPTSGFQGGFVHASPRLLANIERDKTGSVLTFTVAGATEVLVEITLKVKVVGFAGKETLKTGEMILKDVNHEGVSSQLVLEEPLPEDAVITVTAIGPGWQETYEHFVQHAGSGLSTQEEMGMAPLGGQTSSEEAYSRQAPAKIKTYAKPDFSKIAHLPSASQKVLLLFGLFTNHYHIEEALQLVGKDVTVSNAPPTGAIYFPATHEELFGFRAVILSNINAKAIGDMGWELLYDYVQQGGIVVALGGNYTLGNGEFPANSQFLQMLPVDLTGPFDIKWAGKEQAWPIEVASSKSPLLKNLNFDEDPMAFWVHEVKVNSGADVVLTVGPHPALIVGNVGKGKVIVSTMTCMGNPEPGQQAFWETEMWKQLVQNMIKN